MVQAAEQCRRQASWRQAAAELAVAERTLRHWRSTPARPLPRRGRPVASAPQPQRQQVLQLLHQVTGPAVSLASLRAVFPAVPRCVLHDLLTRYRRVWQRRYRRRGCRLQWHRPGSVWAMDHSQATQLVDGCCDQIFAVRDLASHRQLAWCGVPSSGAQDVQQVLTHLFTIHGAPLVLKSDQGSAFTAETTGTLLRVWQVTPLFSPKGLPQYNGALERANSTHKIYTHQQAAADGHAEYWSSANLEAARQLTNAITRPWGHTGPSPDEAWQQRAPISWHERDEFHRQLERQRLLARTELGCPPSGERSAQQQDRVERRAVSQALQVLGYLSKHSVTRAAKTKRRAQLQRALKQYREQQARDAPLSSVDMEPCNDLLVKLPSRATIRASQRRLYSRPTDAMNRRTRRESDQLSWWRNAITLAIRVAKAAKIMR